MLVKVRAGTLIQVCLNPNPRSFNILLFYSLLMLPISLHVRDIFGAVITGISDSLLLPGLLEEQSNKET